MGRIEEFAVHGPGTGGGATLRLFAALHVPTDHAERLADHADAIATTFEDGRPADPSTMHLTWAFLGPVPEEYVPVVAHALDAAAFEVPGPVLCTTGPVATFGRGRALAVEVEVDLLAPLDAARDRFLASITPYVPQVDQRAWRPHVTILRARDRRVLPGDLLARAPHPPSVSWVTPELRLYASIPGPDGNQHRVMHAVPFGAPIPNR